METPSGRSPEELAALRWGGSGAFLCVLARGLWVLCLIVLVVPGRPQTHALPVEPPCLPLLPSSRRVVPSGEGHLVVVLHACVWSPRRDLPKATLTLCCGHNKRPFIFNLWALSAAVASWGLRLAPRSVGSAFWPLPLNIGALCLWTHSLTPSWRSGHYQGKHGGWSVANGPPAGNHGQGSGRARNDHGLQVPAPRPPASSLPRGFLPGVFCNSPSLHPSQSGARERQDWVPPAACIFVPVPAWRTGTRPRSHGAGLLAAGAGLGRLSWRST